MTPQQRDARLRAARERANQAYSEVGIVLAATRGELPEADTLGTLREALFAAIDTLTDLINQPATKDTTR